MGQIPENCNSICRIDESKEFSKSNCQWGLTKRGPKKINGIKKIKRSKIVLHKPRTVTIVIETDHYEFIKRQALQKSLLEGRIIQPNEMIRKALQTAFPAPSQLDIFGETK